MRSPIESSHVYSSTHAGMSGLEMLNFTPATLVLGGLFSLIGMGAFVYGRKTGRIGTIIGGGILTVFPYFVSNPVLIALIGTVIVIGMYLFPE
jgi:hypothetical protein